MIKEFGNCTDDSNCGGSGRYKDAGPSNVQRKDVRDDNSDGSDDGNDEEDPEEESDGDKTQEKGVVHKGQIELKR